MGFRAPSADEVYRYMLRTDGPHATLADGFGWSMVLVSDYSEECRYFLARYGLDLCARTADRVRFVFFSGQPEEAFQDTATRMNRRSGRGPGGLVGAVLGRIARSTRVDFEEEPWSSLRPEAMRPFRTVSDIEAHISWECSTLAAMPGAAMALPFAQRLGIGRHVPCVLVFTDIGDLRVHVLPFRGRSPDDVYSHIRRWVDEYYEINRGALNRWVTVERDIEALSRRAAGSVRQVRDWPDHHRRDWQVLRRLADVVVALEEADDLTLPALLAAAADADLPVGVRDAVRGAAHRLAEFDRMAAAATTIEDRARDLEGRTDPKSIRRALGKLAAHPPPYLPPATVAAAEAAGRALRPRRGGMAWYYDCVVALASRRRFRSWYGHWAGVVPTDPDDVAERERRYAAYWAAAGDRLLIDDPAEAADVIVAAVAAHHGPSVPPEDWATVSRAFHDFLAGRFRELQETAPENALRVDHPLRVRDVLADGSADRDRVNRHLARLLGLPDATELGANQDEIDRRSELSELRRRRDTVSGQLREKARHLSMVGADRSAARAALAVTVEALRADLQSRLLARSSAESGRPPSESLLSDAARLSAALDEYDRSVRAVVHPHLTDPAVIPVWTAMDVAAAAGEVPQDRPHAMERLAGRLSGAVEAGRDAAALWPEHHAAGLACSPAARLDAAFRQVLAPARRQVVLAQVGVGADDERLARAVRHGLVPLVLDAMTDDELTELTEHLGIPLPEVRSAPVLRRSVLVDLGVGRGSEPLDDDVSARLAEKIRHNRFDVFMTHHSTDREIVRELCGLLRRRAVYPWIDIEQIPPGRWFQDALQSAIRTVRTAAVVVGPAGIGPWQLLEIRSFVEQCVVAGVPVIPVLLPGVRDVPEELVFIRQLHAVRFDSSIQEQVPLEQLVWGITGEQPPG